MSITHKPNSTTTIIAGIDPTQKVSKRTAKNLQDIATMANSEAWAKALAHLHKVHSKPKKKKKFSIWDL